MHVYVTACLKVRQFDMIMCICSPHKKLCLKFWVTICISKSHKMHLLALWQYIYIYILFTSFTLHFIFKLWPIRKMFVKYLLTVVRDWVIEATIAIDPYNSYYPWTKNAFTFMTWSDHRRDSKIPSKPPHELYGMVSWGFWTRKLETSHQT